MADLTFRTLASCLGFGFPSIRSSCCGGFGNYEVSDNQYRNYEMSDNQYRECRHFFQDCRIGACISQRGLRGGWFLGSFWERGLVMH